MKYQIVYHKEDNDGVMSGALIKYYLINVMKVKESDIHLYGATYADLSFQWNTGNVSNWWHNDYDYIIMTDISFNDIDAMKFLKKEFKENFVWIDHHAPIISESIKHGFDDVEGWRDSGQSAIMNAYRYFFDTLNIARVERKDPVILRILSAWDSFSYKREGYTIDYVEMINLGMNQKCSINIDKCYKLIPKFMQYNDHDGIWTNTDDYIKLLVELENSGYAIQQYNKERYKRIIDEYGDNSWFVDNNRRCMVLFLQDQTSSRMFECIEDNNIIKNGAVFKRTSLGKWILSLYNIRVDDGFHCGNYLKSKYSGGGHIGAAGCTLTEEQFLELLKTKKI